MARKIMSMKMPVLFVGHGSPMNAIEHNAFTETLSGLSARLPRPKAVCVVSAHWVSAGAQVMASALTQCADTTHTAFGLGRRALSPLSVSVYALCSIAFMGDPCPTNNTGIFIDIILRAISVETQLAGFYLLITTKNCIQDRTVGKKTKEE